MRALEASLLALSLQESLSALDHIVVDHTHESTSVQGLLTGDYGPCLSDAHSSTYHVTSVDSPNSHQIRYKFEPPSNGCYVIEEWHPGSGAQCNRFSTVVRMDVEWCWGARAYTYVDQAKNGGRWNILGALIFFQTRPGNITLTSSRSHSRCREGSGCFWTADALRLTKVAEFGAPCQAPPSWDAYGVGLVEGPDGGEPEVDPEKAASETIHLDVFPVILDDAAADLQTGWKIESLESTPLQCEQHGWASQFSFTEAWDAPPLELSFEPEADGCYLVEEFHPASLCNQALSSEVQLKITYCKAKEAHVVVNQATGGNNWNVVALLPFYKGHTGKVSVKHPQGGSGVATADAFRFTKIAASCAEARTTLSQYVRLSQQEQAMVVDNDQASTHGTSTEACDGSAIGGSAHTVNGSEGGAVYTFVPESTGCYRLDEFHPESSTGCFLSSAKLLMEYCLGKSINTTVDLSTNGKQWNTFAHLPFYAGTPGSVTSQPAGAGLWTADAFRATKVAESCLDIPDSYLLTLRLVGVDLEDPKFTQGGHLTRSPDMRLAFHEAMASVSGLPANSVKLLSMRKGSIVLDFDLSGDNAERGVARVKESFESGNLENIFCEIATVGKDEDDDAAPCEAELLQLTRVPRASDEPTYDHQLRVLIDALAGAAVVSMVTAVLTIGFCRWRKHRAAKDKQTAFENVQLIVPHHKPEKQTSEAWCDNASTGTPDFNEMEVQTLVSGDFEVCSVTSQDTSLPGEVADIPLKTERI